MRVRLGERKRPADERDRAMIGEIGRMLGPAVRPWHLAVAAEVDAAKNDAPAGFVDEPASLHVEFLHGRALLEFCYARKQNKNGGPCPRSFGKSSRIRSIATSSGTRRNRRSCVICPSSNIRRSTRKVS